MHCLAQFSLSQQENRCGDGCGEHGKERVDGGKGAGATFDAGAGRENRRRAKSVEGTADCGRYAERWASCDVDLYGLHGWVSTIL